MLRDFQEGESLLVSGWNSEVDLDVLHNHLLGITILLDEEGHINTICTDKTKDRDKFGGVGELNLHGFFTKFIDVLLTVLFQVRSD